MVILVPAKLHEIFAGMQQTGVLRNRVGSVEVKDLKAAARTDSKQLTRGRDAHDANTGRNRRHTFDGALGAYITVRVSGISGEHVRSIRLPLVDIPSLHGHCQMIGRVGYET